MLLCCCGVVGLWGCGVVGLWCCGVVVLWWCCWVVGLLGCWYCGIVVLWWCGGVVVLVVQMINDTASLSWRVRRMHLIKKATHELQG